MILGTLLTIKVALGRDFSLYHIYSWLPSPPPAGFNCIFFLPTLKCLLGPLPTVTINHYLSIFIHFLLVVKATAVYIFPFKLSYFMTGRAGWLPQPEEKTVARWYIAYGGLQAYGIQTKYKYTTIWLSAWQDHTRCYCIGWHLHCLLT